MASELVIKLTTGLTLRALVLDETRTKRWDGAALSLFSGIADADWATGLITMTEQQTSDATATAIYVGDFPTGITAAGEYTVLFFSGAAPTPGQAALGQQDVWWDGSAMMSPSDNIYTAEAKYTRDQANTQDLYTVQWLKNGIVVPDTSITSPTLTVYLDADTVLINAKAMTKQTTSDLLTYAASAAERLTVGDAAGALFSATIDGAVRTWPLTISRDSS